jgi:TPR repeat protein
MQRIYTMRIPGAVLVIAAVILGCNGNPQQNFERGKLASEKKSYDESIKWYRKAANQGLADAQFELGRCYYYGNGVKKDYSEAMAWYRKASDQGHGESQRRVGLLYAQGEGVSKDRAEAQKWFRKAAENGNAWSQYYQGVVLREGDGVSQDQLLVAVMSLLHNLPFGPDWSDFQHLRTT